MSYTSSCKKSWKRFITPIAAFFAKGFATGKWEFKWTWKF